MTRRKPRAIGSTVVDVLADADSSLFDTAWKGLVDPVNHDDLRTVVRLSKDLDRERARVKALVTQLASFAQCSREDVITRLSDIARAAESSAGFYNTFMHEMDNHPTLKDPRQALLKVAGIGSKESLRTQLSDAKKAVQASTRRRLTK